MTNEGSGAPSIRPLKGTALREALAGRLRAKAPDSKAVLAWNADRRRQLLSTRTEWADPPDLLIPRVTLCVIGTASDLDGALDEISHEITHRGYQLVEPDECDMVVAVVTAESPHVLDGSSQPWAPALRRSVDDGVPLLVLWHGGDRPPFAIEDMVDIRSEAGISNALDDSVPQLSVMVIGLRGDQTMKVRLVGCRAVRKQIEELDMMGQFLNIQTRVVVPTGDGGAGEPAGADLDQILSEITAEADEGRRTSSLAPDAPIPLESSVYFGPSWPGMRDDLGRVRAENEGQVSDTWDSGRFRARLAGRRGSRPEILAVNTPRLFIGYRWENPGQESWVEQFAGELYGRGYDVLFDRHPERLDASSDPADLLYRIAECSHFVAIVTTSYLQALRPASVGDAPWARADANWARREWEKARSLSARGHITLVAAWRSGGTPPPEIDADLVADMRTEETASAELDRLFPPLLVTVVADLPDGQRIQSSPPIPRFLATKVADEMAQRFHPRAVTVYATPGPLTRGDHG